VQSFEKFIAEHKDELTGLQALYSRPFKLRPTLEQLKELRAALERPPVGLKEERVWDAYEKIDGARVSGGGGRVITDLVSLVRFAIRAKNELRPFRHDVDARFASWLAAHEQNGNRFTDEQRQWLEAIRDQIATSLSMEMEDFDYEPFVQRGGLGKAMKVFGPQLQPLLKELNEVLVA
jgi:type I restriction enzyme R subunit